MCKSSWSIAGPEAVYYTFKVFWERLKAASWLHMLRMQTTFPRWSDAKLTTFYMKKQFGDIIYDVSSLCHKVVMVFFLLKSSDIAGVQSFQVFAKWFSIIASIISTVVKASVNLIGINYWCINSHHYSLQWLFCCLLKIKTHKVDRSSWSFDDSFYTFKGVKTQILFTFIRLFSPRAGERSHIPSSFFAISLLKAVICHQVPSGRSAGRQEAQKECCHWPVPASEGWNQRGSTEFISLLLQIFMQKLIYRC